MSRNIDYLINQVAGGATQRALLALWNQLHADAAANKSTFDAHTHRQHLSGSGVDACLSVAGIAIDATPADVQTDYAFSYKIAGVAYYKAVDAAIGLSGLVFTASTLATATSRAYLLTINGSGVWNITEGDDFAGSTEAAAVVPDTPAATVGVAVILVGNIATKAFKLGSDDLGSGSWNVTYKNLVSKEPVITSKPGSDTEDNTQGTAVSFAQNLET